MLKFWLFPKPNYLRGGGRGKSWATTITDYAKYKTRRPSRTQPITAENTPGHPGTGHTDSSKAESQTTRMWTPTTPEAVHRSQRPPGSWKHCKPAWTLSGRLSTPGTSLPSLWPPQGAATGILTGRTVPQDPQKGRQPLWAILEAAMTAKKSWFFTTTPTMPVDYNSQSAAGGPGVNPVVAPGLAIPAPCLAQKPNCCTYFQLSQFETNLEILINNCIYAILTLPFTIKTVSASQNIVPGRVLFVNLQRCQTVR